MNRSGDDLRAVRTVVDAVEGFDPKDQQRIFRWAAEKVGLPLQFGNAPSKSARETNKREVPRSVPESTNGDEPRDLKSFVEAKNPASDVQFAAAVAFFYEFRSPEKKVGITKEDLKEAFRLARRQIPSHPHLTLINAFNAGLLDRAERGTFRINAVGENLVAYTLPGSSSNAVLSAKPTKVIGKLLTRKKAAKKAA
jgi:hypothetical protein